MDVDMWLVATIILGSIQSGLSIPSTAKLTPTVATMNSNKVNPPVVYTAETARLQTVAPLSSTKPNENLGFVNPIDFSSFADFAGNGKSKSSFPMETTSTAAFFPDFFNSGPSDGTSPHGHVREDAFRSMTSSASNQNSRPNGDDPNHDGFVNPNVQFRSLFDTAETDGGFSAADFLKYNPENSRPENSKGSQTQAFPSFTYSGRQDDDEYNESPHIHSSQPPRYRATTRELNDRDHDENREGSNPSDGKYIDGHRNQSPRNTPQKRYQNEKNGNQEKNRNRGDSEEYASPNQDTAHAPAETPPSKEDSPAGGKSKCKKVEKVVDYEEEYKDFNANAAYDPSTYQSRYKRQAAGRNSANKRPMTCFVCEDESGRYAERCSYDSSSDPKKGTYFHSTSTSFTDNGKPRGGGRERHRRSTQTPFNLSPAESESLPKRIQKRQSEGNRYASDFQGDKTNNAEPNYENGQRDFELGHTSRGLPTPSYLEHFPSADIDFSRHGTPIHDSPNRSPHRGRGNEDFEPLLGFGRHETQSSPRFEFDFSIPKEFQQDINQSGTSNTNHHRPMYSAPHAFGNDFDTGYDNYVKQHFPDAFNSGERPSTRAVPLGPGPSMRTSSSPSVPSHFSGRRPTPYGPSHEHAPSYAPNDGSNAPPKYSAPQTEHTHPVHHYAPPAPYSYRQEEGGPEHLEKAISQFNLKDRKDCEKVEKDGMTCYVCRDARGMNKEECMYASNPNDPRNGQMAYHEVTEYSSPQPSHNVLPRPNFTFQQQESKKVDIQVSKESPLEYDFDY